jgi:hypothetical protein
MTVPTMERTALSRLKRILSTDQPDQPARMPLRSALFLIAHEDLTGRPHLDRRTLELGLAAAILLELWLTGRIRIGWREHVRSATWLPEPGRIAVLKPDPIGDHLTDWVINVLQRTGTPTLTRVLHQLASADLYERVRADMILTGYLRRHTRRRFWFFRTESHRPTHRRYPVHARNTVRDAASNPLPANPEETDHYAVALAALVGAIGLIPYLYPLDMDPAELRRRLRAMVPTATIREVAEAVSPR